jgi:ligand-binding SRPBCC domain-containing protein
LTPTQIKVFEHRSTFSTTIGRMIAFHEAPDALDKLTPPILRLKCVRDERTSLTTGEVEFILWFGLIPVRWVARHEPGPTATSFMDRMLRGPLALWEHRHIFQEVEQGVLLIDHITFAHKVGIAGLFSHLIFDGVALHVLFRYRHWRTRRALAASE